MSSRVALITPDGLYLYVLGNGAEVVVIDMTNLVVRATIPVEQPSGVDINQNGHFLYGTSGVSGSVFVIDTDPGSDTFNTVVGIIHVGDGPLSRILADEVRTIDVAGCQIATSISVGTNPTRLAVTPF